MITQAAKDNFSTLLRAAENGDLALMECTRKSDGKSVPVICAVGRDGDEYVFTPLAEFTAGIANPYDVFDPPA